MTFSQNQQIIVMSVWVHNVRLVVWPLTCLDMACLHRCGEWSCLVTGLVTDKHGFSCAVAQIIFVNLMTKFDRNMVIPEFKINKVLCGVSKRPFICPSPFNAIINLWLGLDYQFLPRFFIKMITIKHHFWCKQYLTTASLLEAAAKVTHVDL